MIDWPDNDVAMALGRSFANVAAAAMGASTGMKFTVTDTDDGAEITTDDPKALTREFGDGNAKPESWSVKGIFEAERMFNEPAQGGV